MKKILRIPYDKEAKFKKRLNKFLGITEDGELIHIHDPGRIEFLRPGSKVLLKREFNEGRKTKYDLIAVKSNELIFTNSKYHSQIAETILKEKFERIEKEVKVGESRIDFLVDGVPLEVKGCTLVKNKIALFPDAPTKRGVKHLREIIKHNGYLMFLIFRRSKCFAPNELDKEFYNTFKTTLENFIQFK